MSLHHGLRSAAGASVADPHFANTSLLLLGNGTNGGQNNTFVDGSSNAFSITRYGNTTQGTFSPFGYNWSNYFDGTGDYLTLGGQSNFAFGTGDFTVECWVFPQNNAAVIYDSRPASTNGNYLMFAINSSNQLEVVVNGSVILAAGSIAANSWSHIAVTRSGTSLRGFVNGSQVGSTVTNSTDFLNGTSRPIIAANGFTVTANLLTGNISNLRVLKGTAQYTGSYTVPTAPLTAITNTSLLTCQSNRFIDNSSNAFAITPYGNAAVTNFAPFPTNSEYSTGVNGGSGWFDGSSDVLGTSDSSAWAFGTGDLTIEFWFYVNAFTSGGMYYMSQNSGSSPNWYVFSDSSTLFRFGRHGAAQYHGFTTTLSTGQWYHVAIVRSGTTMYMFLNGVSQTLTSSGGGVGSFDFSSNTELYIAGANSTSGNNYNGYMSNLRILKGTAQYTANFTPSTTPLSNITNTSLLLNFTNASIIDSTGRNDIETVGDAQISTSTKKFGTGSLKFDGNGDRLSIPDSSLWDFGTGDFTVEGWFNFSSTSSVMTLVSNYDYPSSSGWVMQWRNDNGTFNFGYFETGLISYTWTPTTGTWYHLAVCRSGTNLRQFIDGTQVGSTVTNSTNISGSSNALLVGALYYSPLSSFLQYYNGYIDDLRISKVARYTAAFTPPTRQLPAR